MAERYVFLMDIADYLGRANQSVHARTKRLGIKTVLLCREGSGKGALAVSAEDAKRLLDSNVPKAEVISPSDLVKESGL